MIVETKRAKEIERKRKIIADLWPDEKIGKESTIVKCPHCGSHSLTIKFDSGKYPHQCSSCGKAGDISALTRQFGSTFDGVDVGPKLDLAHLAISRRPVPMPKIVSALPDEVLIDLWKAAQFPKATRDHYLQLIAMANSDLTATGNVKRGVIAQYNAEIEAMQAAAVTAELDRLKQNENLQLSTVYDETASNPAYYYQGGVYHYMRKEDMMRMTDIIVNRVFPQDSRRQINANRQDVMNDIKNHMAQYTPVVFDKDYSRINFANGLYNVAERKLEPHTPEFYSTAQIPMPYLHPGAPEFTEPVNFRRALTDWFGDERSRQVFLAMLYYIISGDRSRQLIFFWRGDGGDGKGEAVKILRRILTEKRVASVSIHDLDKPFLVSTLSGKLLNVASEMKAKTHISDDDLKRLSGGDQITADVKYGKPIVFENRSQMLIMSNFYPSTSDLSHGLKRRLKMLEFKGLAEGQKMYNFFETMLEPEIYGILHEIMTAGHAAYVAGVLDKDDADETAIDHIMSRNSIYAFWNDMMESVSDVTAESQMALVSDILIKLSGGENDGKWFLHIKEAYTKYKKFCEDNGYKSGNRESFRQDSEMALVPILKKYAILQTFYTVEKYQRVRHKSHGLEDRPYGFTLKVRQLSEADAIKVMDSAMSAAKSEAIQEWLDDTDF